MAIDHFINGFDYDSLVKRLNDNEIMHSMYDSSDSNYEKLQVFRIIVQGEHQTALHENSVIRKFINGTFHIENEQVMQLDPSKYSPVPTYIIDECDKILEQRNEAVAVST